MAEQIEVQIIAEDMASSVLGSIGGALGGLATAAVAATAALAAIGTAGLVTSVQSAMEAEEAMVRMNAVLEATGHAAGLTYEQLEGMASQLQSVTRYSDETIMTGQAMLLTFRNIGADVFPQATESMLDMAEMFGSVDTAAIQLGKALNDPIAGVGALRRIGVQLTEDQEESIRSFMAVNDIASAQRIILDELAGEFGNVAEAMGETFSGRLEILRNRFDEVRETIGMALIPELEHLLDHFNDQFMPILENVGQAIANFINGEWFAMNVTDRITELMDELAIAIQTGDWSGVFEEIQDAINFFVIDPIRTTFHNWVDSGGPGELMRNIFDAIQTAMGLINWEDVLNFLADVFNEMDSFVTLIMDRLSTAVNTWVASGGPEEFTRTLLGWINEIEFGEIAEMPELQAQAGRAINGLVNALITAVGLIDWGLLLETLDDQIASLLNSIDWDEMGQRFGEFLGDVITFGMDDLVGMLEGGDSSNAFGNALQNMLRRWMDADAFGSLMFGLSRLFSSMFRAVGDAIVDGIQEGIQNAWANLTSSFRAKLMLLISFVKSILGISSPSTVFMEIGREIVNGFIAGWNALFGGFITMVRTAIGNLASDVLSIGSSSGATQSAGVAGDASSLTRALAGGSTTRTGTVASGTSSTRSVVNNYYGPVYFQGAGEPGAYYDCEDPSPLLVATGGSGLGGRGSGVR